MVKINLFSSFVFAFLMMAGTINAQVIWGVGGPTGVADAQFQNAFVNATVAGSYSTTQWTALTISQNAGAVMPGAAYWVRNTNGLSAGGYATGMTVLASPSQANGAALFDSDFMDNAGVQGAFGTGTSPSPHTGALISPRIDLTGQTNAALLIKFHSYYRKYSIDEYSISLSVDDGATWLPANTVDIQALQPVAVNNDVEGQVSTLFSTATSGIANLTQCRIKFTFSGDYYYAFIDDISIEPAPSYDIAMGLANTAGATLGDRIDFGRIGGNMFIPYDNVDPTDLREWLFGGKIMNVGGTHILANQNPSLQVKIDFRDPASGVITPNVYRDSIVFTDTILAGNLTGRVDIAYLDNLNFIVNNPNGRNGGEFLITYWAESDAPNGSTANDTLKTVLTITPSATTGQAALPYQNYQSKARLSTAGTVYGSTAIFPAGNSFESWEYGSVYYFPKGADLGINLDSVHFRYRTISGFTGAATQTMFCNVYQADATAAQGGLDDPALLTLVGFSSATLTGLAPSQNRVGTFMNFLEPQLGNPMADFVNNGFYYITVRTSTADAGGAATFVAEDVPWVGADVLNYNVEFAMSTTDTLMNPSPVIITEQGTPTSMNAIGFGAHYAPSLGLWLNIPPYTSVSTVNATEGAELKVYPNPTAEVLNVSFSLETADDVMYIMTDMTGRVVNILNSKNVTNETQSIDVSKLAAGVYMITAKTSKGTSTERFVKQ